MRDEQLVRLQETLGHKFSNADLLTQALTHSSYANDKIKNKLRSNERLEFLGDSLLGMIVAQLIYNEAPTLKEGSMSKLRAEFICEKNLAILATEYNFGSYMLLSKGEVKGGGQTRPSILADCYEAVLAAMYLDGGFQPVFNFVTKCYDFYKSKPKPQNTDYKTMLQELIQPTPGAHLSYNVISESGPDHDKTFEIEVLINGQSKGLGKGKSKKAAEQIAAKNAYEQLK